LILIAISLFPFSFHVGPERRLRLLHYFYVGKGT
jgi:hypothetical protein